MSGRLRVTLVLEDAVAPSRDGWPLPPAVIRLRRLLKALLRTYGFKCVAAEEVPPPAEGQRRTQPSLQTSPVARILHVDDRGGAHADHAG